MDILLNPNVAYLLLVTGCVLAALALFIPGTGLLEAGALLIILLSVWTISHLAINIWALLTLLCSVFPFVLAVRGTSGKLAYLAGSILAMVAGSTFLIYQEQWWKPAVHPLVALSTSLLVAGFFWVATRKAWDAQRTRPLHDLDTLVGAIGKAITRIDLEGSVQVASELWSAHSQEKIPAGARVRVTGREGFTLEVLAEEQHSSSPL